ncbi:hypothetical protein C1Y63_09335 [Corynebacterium sp. 13CS0277]|uniref:hypothetical protein n=1 Tax=Corynebacterium sp. 13CS0277 TaxID=2071994 RepID=UPI000D030984|nr:hypothetical protein [Corynebacterium sp. 13CS0277]PRQ10833.1 hypothetical protein C1Y63_09335 [Corynebacterium sp. 13CS0277]
MSIDPILTDRSTGRELWTSNQCATYCGITASGWVSGSHRGVYPSAVGKHGRNSVWFADEVIAWREAHPGHSS